MVRGCNDWWVRAPIIGTVKVIDIRDNISGKVMKGDTHKIVRILDDEPTGRKFYVTNESYEPERKCEPLLIVDFLVKKYTPRRKR